jgi:hypothetical protein
MKRAYAQLTDRERRARAEEEAFFDLPGTGTRLELLCFLGVNGCRRIPIDQVGPAARQWLDDRGLLPQEVAR